MNWAILAILGLAGFFFIKPKEAGDVTDTDPFFRYDEIYKFAGWKYNVPWRWLKAIAYNESSNGENPLVKAGMPSSDAKSFGIMQVTLSTAQGLDQNATPEKLNSADYSIDLAAQYVASLMQMFKGDRKKVVMSYNQGPGNTLKGKTYAQVYYERFERNLAMILERQPGDERETN